MGKPNEPKHDVVMTETRKPLVVVGGVIGAIVVVTLIVGALRPAVELDPETPEGVVQTYIQAVLDNDLLLAEESLTVDFLGDCDPRARASDTDRYSIIEADEHRDGYLVTVQQSTSEAFGGGYTQEIDFYLLNQGDDWLIDWAGWPFGCGSR